MSHETYRQRSRVIEGVLEDIDISGGWRIPGKWQLDIELLFGSEAEFVLALYPRWFAALTARLDQVLEDRPAEPSAAVARTARQLVREYPALFALLAEYCDHPALEAIHERERRTLGWAPGARLATLAARRGDLTHDDPVPVP